MICATIPLSPGKGGMVVVALNKLDVAGLATGAIAPYKIDHQAEMILRDGTQDWMMIVIQAETKEEITAKVQDLMGSFGLDKDKVVGQDFHDYMGRPHDRKN